jgi:hypothetical protein
MMMKKDDWINILEKVPPYHEVVLTCYKTAESVGPRRTFAYTNVGWVDDNGYIYPIEHVTHWMKLPDYPD